MVGETVMGFGIYQGARLGWLIGGAIAQQQRAKNAPEVARRKKLGKLHDKAVAIDAELEILKKELCECKDTRKAVWLTRRIDRLTTQMAVVEKQCEALL